jgi:hypothetical protein
MTMQAIMKTARTLVASAGLALIAAACNPVEPVPAAVARTVETVLPLHPDPAPGSGDGAVYDYH